MGKAGSAVVFAFTGAGLAVLAMWGWFGYQPASRSPATPASSPGNPVSVVDGLTVLTLDKATQDLGGIEVSELSAVKHQSQTLGYGTVVDLQPLIDLASRYDTAEADLAAARAAVSASDQESDRSRVLYKDGRSVSLKTAQTAQAAASADKAKLRSAEANEEALHASALQQYGPKLAQLLGGDGGELSRLFDRQDVLVRVVMPVGAHFAAPEKITVDDATHHNVVATLISASPQSDPVTAGSVYFYSASATLSSGSRIVARLPTDKAPVQGVIVPAEALIWYGGQPWAWVLKAPNRFVRNPVSDRISLDGGFFVTSGFRPGDRVVTRGAQLLLSDELRPPPSSVAACKDPECDD